MISKIKFAGIIVGALLFATTDGALADTWWEGGYNNSLSSGIVELQTDMNTLDVPGSGAIANTLFWLGGVTVGTYNGNGADILTQPEVIPVQSPAEWRVQFETVDADTNPNTEIDFMQTNMYIAQSGSVHFVTDVFASGPDAGDNYQEFDDNNNSNNNGSVLFSGATYGSSFTQAFGVLEATDFTSGDWTNMDGTSTFSTFHSCTSLCSQGGGSSISLSTYTQHSGTMSPPSCFTPNGGTGTATIKDAC